MTRTAFRLGGAVAGIACSATVLGLGFPTLAAETDADNARRFVEVRVESDEGKPSGRPAEAGHFARVKVRVRDPATGFAMNGLYPALWIVPDNGSSCGDWYARITGNPLLPDNVIPLVGYDLIQATTEGHVAVIDPVLNLASANIRSLRKLPGPLRDWDVSGDGRTLAVVSEGNGRIELVPFGKDIAPVAVDLPPAHAIAAAASGFWVGLIDGRAVHLTADGETTAPIKVGNKPVSITAGEGGLAVALSADGKGLILDGRGGQQPFALERASRAGALSPLADSFFALDDHGTALFRVDLVNPAESDRHELPAVYHHLAADPRGRWLALRDEAGGSISIFDTQTMRVRWSISMPDPVVEMRFSDNFLYLMHRRQGGVTRVIFDPMGSAPGLAAIAAGIASDTPQSSGSLAHMVRIPGGGIFVASARERQAYMVSEDGAQAAMSSLPLRAGRTAGIMLRLRGLLPTGNDGEYEARFTPAARGRHLALVQTETPRLLHCAPFSVGGKGSETVAARAKPPAAQSYVLSATDLSAQSTMRFRIDGGPARPVELMLMREDGGWRQFLGAPVRDGQDFVVRVDPTPAPGRYRLYVQIAAADGSSATVAGNLRVSARPDSEDPQ